MKIRSLIFTTLISLSFILMAPENASAQFGKDFEEEEEKAGDHSMSRVFFGGGGFFWFNSEFGYLYLSPLVGYRLLKDVDVGIRLSYYHVWENSYFIKYKKHDYGAGFFARYYLFFFRNLFIHGEYEILSYQFPEIVYANGETDLRRELLHNIFLGLGYRQWIGQNAYVSILLLYNFNESEYSVENPVFRIGIGVGL